MIRRFTFRHLYVLETLALKREAFRPREVLLAIGDRTLADLLAVRTIAVPGATERPRAAR